MDRPAEQNTATQYLYPRIDPYDQRMLDVGEGHRLYVEQCGNPDGFPVVVLHGGPGGGCSPAMRRYFDPEYYRVILFDQRGCGRSRPHASVEDNTTWHLVRDIELIRETLGIARWNVFGGSWGATLGLIYGIAHPDRVANMILRSVFLMTQAELDWFYGGGAGSFWPDVWRRFTSLMPDDEQDDLIEAYAKRLFSGDRMTETRYARAWASWENTLASIRNDGPGGDSPGEFARAFARLENHYFRNGGFLEHDGWIEANLHRLADVPGFIVQGRYDMICPPAGAFRLHEGWQGSVLRMIPRAGHALSEPGISAELVQITNGLRGQSR
ncbi:MAG: prolyl aminopeptidase [Silicimonas sp.]|nr:prolyl aminopeptidase [Silicimonas sp.]